MRGGANAAAVPFMPDAAIAKRGNISPVGRAFFARGSTVSEGERAIFLSPIPKSLSQCLNKMEQKIAFMAFTSFFVDMVSELGNTLSARHILGTERRGTL